MAQQLTDRDAKIAYYRKAAAEAERSAARAGDPQTRDGFLAAMRTWIYLAEELEREIALEEKPAAHEEIVVPPDGEARNNHSDDLKATNKSRL